MATSVLACWAALIASKESTAYMLKSSSRKFVEPKTGHGEAWKISSDPGRFRFVLPLDGIDACAGHRWPMAASLPACVYIHLDSILNIIIYIYIYTHIYIYIYRYIDI